MAFNDDAYRYGFQEQEQDKETGLVNYKYRMHDPRIGRFFAVDPLAAQYTWNSPYAFSENRVIDAVELEGLEKVSVHSASFAPFDSFGGGYKGDGKDRSFGDKEITSSSTSGYGSNYRIYANTKLDLATNKIISKFTGHTQSVYNGGFGHRVATSPTNFQEGPSLNTGKFFMQMQGNDDAVGLDDYKVPSWANPGYIDVKVDVQFTEIKFENAISEWSISGKVYGDRYPSNKTYITDESGNMLFLGVSGVDNVMEYGPQLELLGTAQEGMSKFQFTVVFEDENTFMGVRLDNGDFYGIDAWNEMFKDLNPASQETGTNVTTDEVETNYNPG